MEWKIDVMMDRRGDTLATVVFSFEDYEIGAIDVDPQTHGTPDMAFYELIKKPHRWNILPPELHDAFVTYRRETLADVDPRNKTYRFLPIGESTGPHWRLTDDKRDLHTQT